MEAKKLILLVGDIVEDRALAIATRSYDVDKPTRKEIDDLIRWIVEAGYSVDFQSVHDFIARPPFARDLIALPLWRGGPSRNRTAVVPAICEELGIMYVGGDVFVQTVCQDKSLSKVFARNSGIQVPAEWLLPDRSDLRWFAPSRRMSPPFVVKPQYSAASLGIDEQSLCANDEEAVTRAAELFEQSLSPVICEEFVVGDEVSLCFIEEKGELVEKCVAAYLDNSGSYPYRDTLLTFDRKAAEDDGCDIQLWPGQLTPSIWEAAGRIVHLLGKVDYMRLDGRLDAGKFTLIEITQDSHLGLTSEFLGGFNAAGLAPSKLLDRLIRASRRNQAT